MRVGLLIHPTGSRRVYITPNELEELVVNFAQVSERIVTQRLEQELLVCSGLVTHALLWPKLWLHIISNQDYLCVSSRCTSNHLPLPGS